MPARIDVGKVLAQHLVANAADVRIGLHAPDLLHRDAEPRLKKVVFLPPDPAELVEPAVKVHGRFELVVNVGHQSGVVPVMAQDLGHRDPCIVQRVPSGPADEIALAAEMVGEGKDPSAGIERLAHLDRGQALGVGLGESERLGRKPVQAGSVGAPAITANVVAAQRIERDQDDVGRFLQGWHGLKHLVPGAGPAQLFGGDVGKFPAGLAQADFEEPVAAVCVAGGQVVAAIRVRTQIVEVLV